MVCFSRLKLLALAVTIVGTIAYLELRSKEETFIAATLASGSKASYEASNLSSIKRLQSLSYLENPYQATTGYPD